MSKSIKDIDVIIVEDENKNIDVLERILLNEGIKQIRVCKDTESTIDQIERQFPDVILLDLKIPYTKGGVEDSINSFNIILEVERINRIHEHHIKIIIISGTTQERGLQKIIARDKSLIQHMFDKGLMGDKSTELRAELIRQINNVVTYPVKKEAAKVSIIENLDRVLYQLKEVDYDLFAYFNNEVLCNYEEIEAKTEKIMSQGIIIRCGIIIEDIIQQLDDSSKGTSRKISAESSGKSVTEIIPEEESSVRKKLIRLSGRSWDYDKKLFEVKGEVKISRQACEYGIVVYRSRNYASHNGKTDPKNENIYSDNNYTKEHALTSITLLTPLLQDYIKYKTK